jgi:hypothetical protein
MTNDFFKEVMGVGKGEAAFMGQKEAPCFWPLRAACCARGQPELGDDHWIKFPVLDHNGVGDQQS